MNAFARALEAYIEHGIAEGKWPSRRQWCKRAGTNSSNLTGILKNGLFPAVPTLKGWLEKASATEGERDELLTLCSKVKAEKSQEMSPHLAGLHERIDLARAIIATLVGLCAQKGLEVPDDLQERIRTL